MWAKTIVANNIKSRIMKSSHIVAIFLFLIVAILILQFLKYLLKKQIISSSLMDEPAIRAIFSEEGERMQMLKWGIILFFAATGLIVLEYVPNVHSNQTLPYGIELAFTSLGFLVYYLVSRPGKK